jgi:hypothetical protein
VPHFHEFCAGCWFARASVILDGRELKPAPLKSVRVRHPSQNLCDSMTLSENNFPLAWCAASVSLMPNKQHGFCFAVLQGQLHCAMLTHWKPSMELRNPQLMVLGAYRVVKTHN